MQKTALTTLAVASLCTLFTACSKTENSASGNSTGRLEVFLTDAPGNFDSVFIDVQDVRVNYSSDSLNGWQSLGSGARGPVNLLQLVNDRDTLLGASDITTGRIEQIRLLLGSNNYVVAGGQRYNLETPSAQQSGLKLNIHQDVVEGTTYRLVLDFDAGRSIHQTGNGRYMLKPVIRTTLQATGGGLRGFVTPATVRTAVYALQGTDTVAGTFTSSGAWTLRGLSAGSYDLSFVPTDSSYATQTRPGVAVSTTSTAVVDTVRLQ
ncbi:DUF4382 domain-containing protein [Flaviaesturariibacter aridisoli]|uniref:DUF4382 domain-containing protein n=1 Tax=Flaviaesturariibacter aridisoli TaxID=2545761 RepID=A0A4R4E6I6_9BACT|nr:DUF4382 domain-containing protein [Flaviaesturariibacter aridisoli]TCZ74513.1 DUF4382 domain-containing protein [Flaviaesturariibacter aridisoli]